AGSASSLFIASILSAVPAHRVHPRAEPVRGAATMTQAPRRRDEDCMTTRTERDTFGPIEVPSERLWGAQTQRSLQNFRISGERMPEALVHALVLVKKAAALVNVDLGLLDARKAQAIVAAADEVLAGRHPDEFP